MYSGFFLLALGFEIYLYCCIQLYFIHCRSFHNMTCLCFSSISHWSYVFAWATSLSLFSPCPFGANSGIQAPRVRMWPPVIACQTAQVRVARPSPCSSSSVDCCGAGFLWGQPLLRFASSKLVRLGLVLQSKTHLMGLF